MSQEVPPTGLTGEETDQSGAPPLCDGDMARYWLTALIESADDAIISKTLDDLITSSFQHIGILSLEFHVDKLSRPLL